MLPILITMLNNTSIFDLPHKFIIFHPGAGGNFIFNLVSKIHYNIESDVVLSSSGHAHAESIKKMERRDYLDCGMRYQSQFNTPEEKLTYYKDLITDQYQTVDCQPEVVWTHDFSNIPLYRNLFPNCRILVITQESVKEKLVITLLQQLKNRLDSTPPAFVDEDFFNNQTWISKCVKNLTLKFGEQYKDIVAHVLKNRKRPEYFPIVAYATFRTMLKYYKLIHHIDESFVKKKDIVNCVIETIPEHKHAPYKIVNPYRHYIDNECSVLPYRAILENKPDELADRISSLLDNRLDQHWKDFIQRNLKTYLDAQDQFLLNDPVGYLKQIEIAAGQALDNIYKHWENQ